MAFLGLNSWTVDFVRKHWWLMTPASILRYRNYVLRPEGDVPDPPKTLAFRLRRPIAGDVLIRPRGADPYTFSEVFGERVYEPVVARLPGAEYLIDLGANIGLASLYFARAYRDVRILAVEPDEGNYSLLTRNVAGLIRSGHCRTLRAAVWGHKTRVALVTPDGADDHYNAISARESAVDGSPMVEAVTMKDVLEISGFPRVDLLKIDIEGAESQLFQGDVDWLSRVRMIAVEFHGESREASGFDRVMGRAGFHVEDVNRHTVIATQRR